jgi:ubiquitin-like modifier-activating enzyme ATG7
VSPRDSLKDRTLDQMCTVTRPGLAPIAAATAVELLVAVLHSPQGKYVGADKPSDGSAPMGYIPHQLRGFLNAFQNLVITGESFDKCIACSSKVLDAYDADALGLLEKACNSTAYLEELTGLNQLTEEADSLMIDLEDSDEDGDMI